jgi:hypothetical protein
MFIAGIASWFDFGGLPESNRHSLGLRLGPIITANRHLGRRLQLSGHFFVSPFCVHFSVCTDESLLFPAETRRDAGHIKNQWPSQRGTTCDTSSIGLSTKSKLIFLELALPVSVEICVANCATMIEP